MESLKTARVWDTERAERNTSDGVVLLYYDAAIAIKISSELETGEMLQLLKLFALWFCLEKCGRERVSALLSWRLRYQ